MAGRDNFVNFVNFVPVEPFRQSHNFVSVVITSLRARGVGVICIPFSDKWLRPDGINNFVKFVKFVEDTERAIGEVIFFTGYELNELNEVIPFPPRGMHP
jgi:hypothetical protein